MQRTLKNKPSSLSRNKIKIRPTKLLKVLPTRTFSSSPYDLGSAVSTPKPKGPKPIKKPTATNAQQRYEQLSHNKQSKQSAQHNSNQQQLNKNNSQSKPNQQQQSSHPQHNQSTKPRQQSKQQQPGGEFESVFKNSRLSSVFAQTPTHQSFWSRMNDGDTVYLVGTRRLVDPHGRSQDSTFCLLQRTIDKQLNEIHDRLVALDYESGMPFEQYLTTTIEEDMSHATAVDKDQESGEILSRTFLRLRGDAWKWHSAVAMSKIEPRIHPTMSQELIDSIPETYAVSRMKFSENGVLAEKLIKQNDKIVLTICDEMKITTQQIFEQKTEKVFSDYSSLLTQELERNAQNFSGDEDGDVGPQQRFGANQTINAQDLFDGMSGIAPKH